MYIFDKLILSGHFTESVTVSSIKNLDLSKKQKHESLPGNDNFLLTKFNLQNKWYVHRLQQKQ